MKLCLILHLAEMTLAWLLLPSQQRLLLLLHWQPLVGFSLLLAESCSALALCCSK